MGWGLFIGTALVAMVAVAAVLIGLARQFRSTRPWVVLAAISVAAMPVGIVLHNLVSALAGGEEAMFFVIALVGAPVGFAVGTLGSGVTLLRKEGSRRLGASLLVAGAGMASFALYGLVAAVATTLAGGNLAWQPAVEAVVLPVSSLGLVGGALAGLYFLFRADRVAAV